uniref:hypothetical protein n=1 Tax=Cyathus pallidus TaxID=380665 RepID=UPI002551F73C|nr:hypothetical protein QQP23_mgp05 [Cyathus pallidus]WEV87322.1 hypothetical protein [Cyathus pallidus]
MWLFFYLTMWLFCYLTFFLSDLFFYRTFLLCDYSTIWLCDYFAILLSYYLTIWLFYFVTLLLLDLTIYLKFITLISNIRYKEFNNSLNIHLRTWLLLISASVFSFKFLIISGIKHSFDCIIIIIKCWEILCSLYPSTTSCHSAKN